MKRHYSETVPLNEISEVKATEIIVILENIRELFEEK